LYLRNLLLNNQSILLQQPNKLQL